jgi:hypothetical protein
MEDLLSETHYVDLQAPSHVYCLSKVNHQSMRATIVAATFKLVAIEAIETTHGNIRWNTNQLSLPKDGRGIEIISLNSFNQLNKENSPIIAYTTVEATYSTSPTLSSSANNSNNNPVPPPESSEEIKRTFYLNICGTNSTDKSSWEEIAEDRQILRLDYTPFKIAYIKVLKDRQFAILVSGSDCQLHLYKQDERRQWIEHRLQAYFPELSSDLTSCVLSIEIEEFVVNEQNHRFIALGCQDGQVVLHITNLDTKKSQKHSMWLDGPISALKLYKCHSARSIKPNLEQKNGKVSPVIERVKGQLREYVEQKKKLKQKLKDSAGQKSAKHSDHHVDLAVAGAIGYAVVFHHVIEHGFENAAMLTNSDTFDAIMSINVADVDWDGHMEILLSTYGQQLVIYKDTRHSHKNKELKVESKKPTPENKRKSMEAINNTGNNNSNFMAGSLPKTTGIMTGVNTSTTEHLTAPPMSSTPKRSQITQLLQEMSMNQSTISSAESSPAITPVVTPAVTPIVTPVKPNSRRGSRAILPEEPLQHDGIMINNPSSDTPGSIYHPSGEDWIDPSVPRSNQGFKALKGRSYSFTRNDVAPSPLKVNLSLTTDEEEDDEHDDADEIYQITAQISFAHPIFDVLVGDVTNDGLDDFVITSMYGVHLFQLNIHAAKQRLAEKLAMLKRIHELEQLLGESTNNER